MDKMKTMYKDAKVLSASTVIGDTVRNAAGEDLGELKEVMLDMNNGRIAYAVLSFGGFLGLGDKLFAIPWEALTLNPEEHTFTLNVDKEKLETAPGFDKNHWPETAGENDAWLLGIYDHYGYTPYWRQ